MEPLRKYKRVPKKTTYNGKEYTLKVYEDTTEKQMQLALEIVHGPEKDPVTITMWGPDGGYLPVKINNPTHPHMPEAVDLVYNWRDETEKPRHIALGLAVGMPK